MSYEYYTSSRSKSGTENNPGYFTTDPNTSGERERPPDRVLRNPHSHLRLELQARSRDHSPAGADGGGSRNQYVRSKYVVQYVHGVSPESILNDRLIKDLTPRNRALRLTVIYLELVLQKKTRDNVDIFTLLVADKSGSAHFTVFGELPKLIVPGDILKIYNAHTMVYKNQLIIKIGTEGTFERIGDFCMIFKEDPFMSEPGRFPEASESVEKDKEKYSIVQR